MKTKEENAKECQNGIQFSSAVIPHTRPAEYGYLKGYEDAEHRITELEEALKRIIKLSSNEYIQECEREEFLDEWDKWTKEAKELLKTE